ncbi:MAG TPA: hypothetical protein VHA11_01935 [Bryobacteraceae bacterium]|nr:hypothetical protein [Bryobacteraceae bacterium]
MPEIPEDPRKEYEVRLAARRAKAGELEGRHIALGNARLAVAAIAVVIAWLTFGRHAISGWWLLAPAAAFAVLAIIHGRVLRARRRAERSIQFYEQGLARIDDRWHGTGPTGERFDDPAHPYAEDLDLFGNGSLFQLLSTARLRTGEETLARWLSGPAAPGEVESRHGAIHELRPRLNLREDAALLGEEAQSGINPGALAAWAEQPIVFDSKALRHGSWMLAVLAVAGLVVWAVFSVPEFFLAVFLAESILFLRIRRRVKQVVEAVGEPAYGLALLAGVLARFERERFESPRLVALRKELDVEGVPPSVQVARLNRLMEMLESSEHVLMRAIGPVVLYVPQLAFAIEAWRKKSGPFVRKWLAAVGEMEALCSLANYTYEHPADVFPEFVEGGPCYEGQALAHPLLPEGRAVRNDVRLCGELHALIVSGSNMSGKSTLLRTVGVNAVLAMAGAPVRARGLRLSRLALGASIRTLDSLQGGTSRFYAEIKRIRALVDLGGGPLPLLFLLDELLNGTNSHDRRIGAEAILRGLLDRGAIGLLTTHDLALTEIASALEPRTSNVHFEDHLEDGHITFDYRLRPGVVQKSNALELMRSIGLEV